MFAALYGRIPWEKTTIFQVDERIAPDGDPDRNLTLLQQSLPPGGVADVRPMPVTADDLEEAAARYASALPERLDLDPPRSRPRRPHGLADSRRPGARHRATATSRSRASTRVDGG